MILSLVSLPCYCHDWYDHDIIDIIMILSLVSEAVQEAVQQAVQEGGASHSWEVTVLPAPKSSTSDSDVPASPGDPGTPAPEEPVRTQRSENTVMALLTANNSSIDHRNDGHSLDRVT